MKKLLALFLSILMVMSTATFSVFADENAGEAVTGGAGATESAVGGSSDTGEPISPKEPETTAPSDDGGNAGETADSDVTDIQPPLDGETAGTEGDLAADQPGEEESEVEINEENFPDANFRSYVSAQFDTDGNRKLSKAEREKVTAIYNVYLSTSLKGIEYFTELKELTLQVLYFGSQASQVSLDLGGNTKLEKLTISGTPITSLDLSKNTKLENLTISNTYITSLDLSQNTALTYLDYSSCPLLTNLIVNKENLLFLGCVNNSLTSLDLSQYPNLEGLNCSGNQLTSLDVSNNTALTTLNCSGSQLTSLDVSNNTALTTLNCSGNQLTSLDVSNNTALTSLDCGNLVVFSNVTMNQLTNLDVSKNTALTSLDCSNNQLTSLEVSNNTALTSLDCGNFVDFSNVTMNQITSLDVSNNTALTSLDCSNNQLTSLDVSKNTALTSLDCSGNQLTNLDVSNNTQLQRLLCSGNKLAALDLSQNKSLGNLDLNGQRITLAASLADGNYQVDLTDAVGAENLDKVSIIDQNYSYDPETGIVTLGDALEEFIYGYNTGAANQYQSSAIMTVTVLSKSEGVPVSYVEINEENFPDANFRSYVSAQFDQDKSGTLSKKELDSVTRIDYGWYPYVSTPLKGIEYFTELKELTLQVRYIWSQVSVSQVSLDLGGNTKLENLTISGGPITSLDLSKNTKLESLTISSTYITSLDLSQNTALTTLNCYGNRLTSLDLSNNTQLLEFSCSNNGLTSLDVSKNTALTSLNCSGNQLTSLDVSNNTALTSLNCYGNQLTSLDVSQHTKLRSLSCSDNLLSSLDVSNNTALTTLNCSGNQLTSLDVSNNIELTYLDCGINILYSTVVGEKVPKGNHLTSLDVSKNTALTTLYCSGNRLTSLDVSKNTALTTLYCSNNQLTSLDVSKNTALTVLDCSYNQLSALDLSSNTHLNQLNCSYNRITRLEVSQNGFYGYQFVTAQFFTAPASLVDGVWQADMSGILGDEKDSFELYGSTDSYRYENGILYLGSDINPRQILLYKVLDSNNRRALELYISAQMVSENLIDRVEVSNAAIACYIGDKPTASATVPSGANYKIIREVWTEYEGFNLTYPVAYWYSDGNYPEGVKTFTEFSAGKRYSYQIILQADDGWNFADPSYYYDENNIQTSDLTVVLNGSYLPERASLYINTLTITNSYVSAGYKITDGANSSWTQNSDAELSFTSNGNRSRLQYVTVDGAVLTAEQFSVASDSSVITLKKEFLDTLSAGEHMLQIVFADGNAYTVFTINPPYNPPAEHQHFFTWQYNSGSHWQVCLECGAVLAPSSHQFMGNICAVCGYIAPYTQLTASQTPGANVKIEIVDEDGFPVSDLSVELRSLPKYATTNAYGIATFNGVEFGTHTINILDSLGRILASKSFSLIPGSSFSISKDAVIAEQNSTIALSLVYSGNELTLAEDDNSVFVDIPTEVRIVKEDNEIVAD